MSNNPLRYVDPSGNIPVLIALLGKAIVNYSIDVMIGVGFDYLSYVESGSSSKFNMTASLKKNVKESAVPGLGFIKKVSSAMKLADNIKAAQKAAKAKMVKSSTSTKGTGNGYKYWNKTTEFKNVKVYQRDDIINPNMKDAMGRTNLERMKKGLAPLGPDGKSINLHHTTQRNTSSIAEVTQTFHKENAR